MSFWSGFFSMFPKPGGDNDELATLVLVTFIQWVKVLKEGDVPGSKQRAADELRHFLTLKGENDSQRYFEKISKIRALKRACRNGDADVRRWAGALLRRHYLGL